MEFKPFGKISRLSRECCVTEKIDGTNACITITEDGQFLTASRTRWITPQDDNYGFSKWAHDNKEELMKLGVGQHFGEWWGVGIQRGYGLSERRFSMFNVGRWCLNGQEPKKIATQDQRIFKTQDILPKCVGLVPVLYEGMFDTFLIDGLLNTMEEQGSIAVKGFMKPEGVVVYHKASGHLYKKTLEKDNGKNR